MKFFKKTLFLNECRITQSSILLVFVFSFVFYGCKGPQGPDGSDAVLSDSLPPWIQWVSPESNVTVDSIVGLIVRAGDENGIWRIVFSIGGFEYSPDSVAGEYYYYTWNCRRFPEGPYPVVSRAWDAARNSAITPVRMVEVKH